MSKKKGYPRKAYSIERTLKDLVDEIGYEEVEKAINKKKSSIQNISNPLYKERQLSHQDAIDLDIHMIITRRLKSDYTSREISYMF